MYLQFFVYISVHMSAYQFVHYLSMCQSVRLSVGMHIFVGDCMLLYRFVCLLSNRRFDRPSVLPSCRLSVRMNVGDIPYF